ncbi:hypothetical protein PoB_006537500 [Plakobranchus ocellatus]|uniref:Uncharacterized protein n=1 Tax=Plakobranchus ocellatus TaxID=259542 RepID=A0AAV4D431_9GAST|nr:hypothetical protein PoB_006537500 [Plakobranchus ocellatus]
MESSRSSDGTLLSSSLSKTHLAHHYTEEKAKGLRFALGAVKKTPSESLYTEVKNLLTTSTNTFKYLETVI